MPEETKVAPKRKSAKAKTATPAAVTEKRVDESPKAEEPVPEPTPPAPVATPPVPQPASTASAHSHEELEASVASLEARLQALKEWIEDCANIGTDPLRKNRLKKLRDI